MVFLHRFPDFAEDSENLARRCYTHSKETNDYSLHGRVVVLKPLYLVTGAAGHLGSAVVQRLLAHNRDVRAFALPEEPNIPEGITDVCFGDVRDKASLERFFRNPEDTDLVVIHTAGIVTIASVHSDMVYDVNVVGTQNVIDMCRKHNAKTLLYTSSVHAFPETRPNQTIKETERFSPNTVHGLYAKTKAEATRLVLEAGREGLDVRVVHPSGICGPYDNGRGHLTALVTDYCNQRLHASVKGGHDFVDVRDVADGIMACLKTGKPGECYILSNRYYSVDEILNMLQKITGIPRTRLVLPLWLARLGAPFAELYYMALGRPPLFTPYSLRVLSADARYSHQKASDELGYRVRDMHQTLKDTVDWLCLKGRI